MARILIADDEPIVRNVLKLQLSGHDLTFATTWPESLAALGQGEFDLLVTDVVMPGLDELGDKELKDVLGPYRVPVIFISGFADRAMRELPENMCFMQKPSCMQGIVAKVEKMLEPSSSL